MFCFDLQSLVSSLDTDAGLGAGSILDSDLLDVVTILSLTSLQHKLDAVGLGGLGGDVYILEAADVEAREDFSRELLMLTGAGVRRERRMTELQCDMSTLQSNSGNKHKVATTVIFHSRT